MNFDNLLEKQMEFTRVANAFKEKGALINQLLVENGIKDKKFKLLLRSFKEEQKLEVWIRSFHHSYYVLLKTYDFTAWSGMLGPKRQAGDRQIPEGIYRVTNFNPESVYHLSLRLNYPNEADSHFSDKANPGGDIYLHGGKTSTGCIAIGDANIEELYLLSVYAAMAGNLPDVHIYPAYLDEECFRSLLENSSNQTTLTCFWCNLKIIFDDFERTRRLCQINTTSKGMYYLAG